MICNNGEKSNSNSWAIMCIHSRLEAIYPKISMYESRSTLWRQAKKDGVVTDKEVEQARSYFGNLWNYTGD